MSRRDVISLFLNEGQKKKLSDLLRAFLVPLWITRWPLLKCEKWQFCSQDVHWQNEITKVWHGCGGSNPLSIITVSRSELWVCSELPFRKLLHELNRCHTPWVILCDIIQIEICVEVYGCVSDCALCALSLEDDHIDYYVTQSSVRASSVI